MSKPWEQYANPSETSGPWSQYQAAEPPQEDRPNIIQRGLDWATAGITGSRTEPSIPRTPATANLDLTGPQAAQMTALLATTASDDRLRTGIQKIIPEAQFDTDQYGNLVAIVPVGGSTEAGGGRWTRFYPNPSGLGATDIAQAAGAVTLGQSLAGLGTKLFGANALGLLGGATIGATEAGLIEGASSRLSGAPFQLTDIPLGAAGGAVGAKLAQAAERLIAAGRPLLDASGAVTPAGARVLRDLGINADDMGPEFARSLDAQIRRGLDPSQAAVSAEAQSLDVPVELTRGQLTGNQSQQLIETEAAKGVYGETARDVMSGAFERQQQQLQANIPALQQRLAGADAPIAPREGGARAQEALSAQRTAAEQQARDLYAQARAAGEAFIPEDAAVDVTSALRGAVSTFNPRAAPNTYGILEDISRELGATGRVSELMALRSQLANAGQAGSPDAAAGAAAARELDTILSDMVDSALIEGNPEMVEAWARAVRNYRSLNQEWNTNGILSKLTERTTRDGVEGALVVAPEDAANVLLGASANNMINKRDLLRNLQAVRSRLSEPEWNALRQEAFLRIFDTAQRSGRGETSGLTFSSTWNRFKRQNPDLLNELFTEQEQGLFNQFAAVATRVSDTARNTSNSATAMGAIVPRLMQAFGQTSIGRLATLLPIMQILPRAARTANVIGARNAQPQVVTTPMRGAGIGGASAISTNQDAQNIATGRTTGPR